MGNQKPYENIDWKDRIQIILGYLPPYVRLKEVKESKRKVVVYDPKLDVFLRGANAFLGPCDRDNSKPFWDVYGDDFETVESARKAIEEAPEPKPCWTTFEIKLNKIESK